MKQGKTTLLLAGCVSLSLLCSTAQAAEDGSRNIEIYGEVEVRSVSRDDVDHDTFVDKARLGMKGDHPLEKFENLEARWQIEYNLPVNSLGTDSVDSGDSEVRKAQINLQGGFGEFIFGRQNNGLVDTKKMDQFRNDSGVFLRGPDRVGNTISYITPSISGFHAYGQAVADAFTGEATDPDTGVTSSGSESDDVDATTFGINYVSDNVYVGLSRFDVDELYTGEQELTSLGFQVGFGDFAVFGTYQDESYDDFTVAGLGVSYAFDAWTLKLGHTVFEDDANLGGESSDDEGAATTLLANYALGDGIGVFVQYIDYDSDAEDGGFGGDAISVGIDAAISKVFDY